MSGIARLGACAAGLALLSSVCGLLSSPTPARMPRISYLSPGPREAMISFVEQPTTFDLTVNVKTLHTWGLTMPPSVLPLVTEWIR